jgi:DNA-binding transcriptional ArsR family regulator
LRRSLRRLKLHAKRHPIVYKNYPTDFNERFELNDRLHLRQEVQERGGIPEPSQGDEVQSDVQEVGQICACKEAGDRNLTMACRQEDLVKRHKPTLLKILGNESRLRILMALRHHTARQITIYRIAIISGLERKVIRGHLPMLVAAKLIASSKSSLFETSRIMYYGLNADSEIVQILLKLFEKVDLWRLDKS